jgi:hypothetical protein
MNQITLERFLTLLLNGDNNFIVSLVEHNGQVSMTKLSASIKRPAIKVEYITGKLDHSDYYELLHSSPPKLSPAAKKYISAGWENDRPPTIGVTTRAGMKAQNRL